MIDSLIAHSLRIISVLGFSVISIIATDKLNRKESKIAYPLRHKSDNFTRSCFLLRFGILNDRFVYEKLIVASPFCSVSVASTSGPSGTRLFLDYGWWTVWFPSLESRRLGQLVVEINELYPLPSSPKLLAFEISQGGLPILRLKTTQRLNKKLTMQLLSHRVKQLVAVCWQTVVDMIDFISL